jgi:phospholipid-translocating ATPase
MEFLYLFKVWLFWVHCNSVIFERLGESGREYVEKTKDHLAKYGDAGLRTLALAYRKLDESTYQEWNEVFQKAKITIDANRSTKLDEAAEMIEKDLILVGATAVEDKLQKGVCMPKFERKFHSGGHQDR